MSEAHVLRAMSEALADPLAFLSVIADSEDRDAATKALQAQFGWDEVQARLAMGMSFRYANRADRDLLRQDYERAPDEDAGRTDTSSAARHLDNTAVPWPTPMQAAAMPRPPLLTRQGRSVTS